MNKLASQFPEVKDPRNPASFCPTNFAYVDATCYILCKKEGYFLYVDCTWLNAGHYHVLVILSILSPVLFSDLPNLDSFSSIKPVHSKVLEFLYQQKPKLWQELSPKIIPSGEVYYKATPLCSYDLITTNFSHPMGPELHEFKQEDFKWEVKEYIQQCGEGLEVA